MFWKYDDEEEKVVPRGQAILTASKFAKRAREAGHASFVHGLDEEDQERIFDELKAHQDEDAFSSSNEDGSEERFENRVEGFKKKEKPVYKHHFWWFVHNCIAHPFIGVLPCKTSFDFHDWTSTKINGK